MKFVVPILLKIWFEFWYRHSSVIWRQPTMYCVLTTSLWRQFGQRGWFYIYRKYSLFLYCLLLS